jgi:hypothetical protein
MHIEILMVRRRVSAVSNHEADVATSFETRAAQAPQDEGIELRIWN